MKSVVIGCLAAAVLEGCVLAPDSIRPEIEHMSHATQHWPIASSANQTHYGVETAEVMAHWDVRRIAYIEIGEGLALNRSAGCRQYDDAGYGEIIGPREQFIARVGFVIPLK